MDGTTNGKAYVFFIDTGSAKTIVTRNFLDSLKNKQMVNKFRRATGGTTHGFCLDLNQRILWIGSEELITIKRYVQIV